MARLFAYQRSEPAFQTAAAQFLVASQSAQHSAWVTGLFEFALCAFRTCQPGLVLPVNSMGIGASVFVRTYCSS